MEDLATHLICHMGVWVEKQCCSPAHIELPVMGGRAGPVPGLGYTVEQALMVQEWESQPCGHESRGTGPAPLLTVERGGELALKMLENSPWW